MSHVIYLADLPDDIISVILLSAHTIQDTIALATTCKQFYRILEDELLWAQLYEIRWGCSPPLSNTSKSSFVRRHQGHWWAKARVRMLEQTVSPGNLVMTAKLRNQLAFYGTNNDHVCISNCGGEEIQEMARVGGSGCVLGLWVDEQGTKYASCTPDHSFVKYAM